MIKNDRNRRFEEFLDSILDAPAPDDDLTPEKAKERKAIAGVDEFQFCRVYFPKIFNEPFNDLHQWLKTRGPGRHTASGHRRSGKSAYIYIAKAIRHIALKRGGVVGLGARKIDVAKEKTGKLFRLITKNKKLCYDYGIRTVQEEKGYYILGNTHLVATSVNTGLRSIEDDDFKRFVLFIADDLYDRTTVASELSNQKVLDWIQYEVDGQLEPGGTAYILGNSITSNCPMISLKKEKPDHHFSFPAKDRNGETNWKGHSLFTTKYWEDKEQDTPAPVWSGDFMDEPYEVGDLLQWDWVRFVNVNIIKIEAVISALDPSRGQSAGASYKAIATVGVDQNRKVYVLDIYLRKEGFPKVFDYVQELRAGIPAWNILYFENDFAQWEYAEKYYQDWLEAGHDPIPIMLFTAKQLASDHFGGDKEGRILNLVHPHQTGRLMYNENLKGTKDFDIYKHQYLAFGAPEQEKLDGLDALATAFLKIPGYIVDRKSPGKFKALKQRLFKRNSLFD